VDVPPERVDVRCDPSRAVQILSNLVGNSIKFTPGGGSITLSAQVTATHVMVSVTDSGPGIPPLVRPRIFERFWSADEAGRKGRGLGLYIAKGLVEAQGGAIWVDSPAGGGTTFSFTLPLASAAEADRSRAATEHGLTRTRPDRRHLISLSRLRERVGVRARRFRATCARERVGRGTPLRATSAARANHPGSGGGGGGGGGGGAGGLPAGPGGPIVAPGGIGGGAVGILFGGSTHDVRSKNRNSSAFACGDIMLVLQPTGTACPGPSRHRRW
jgi:hypothetical protein